MLEQAGSKRPHHSITLLNNKQFLKELHRYHIYISKVKHKHLHSNVNSNQTSHNTNHILYRYE
jgi:hypothetical protein